MLILASASPRRRELTARLGLPYRVLVPDADETLSCPHTPEETVRILSRRKAEAAAILCPDDIVLGSDTVVALDGAILGKPKDEKDAARMLSMLSGRTHEVFSGFTLIGNGKTYTGCSVTSVRFTTVDKEEIARYIATGEPMDKAGAYGIQGRGGLFVDGICGDYNTVVGLPLGEVYDVLKTVFEVEFT